MPISSSWHVAVGIAFMLPYAFLLIQEWQMNKYYKTVKVIHQNLNVINPDIESFKTKDGFIYSTTDAEPREYNDSDFNLVLPDCFYAKKKVQICKKMSGLLGLFFTRWESAEDHNDDKKIKYSNGLFNDKYYYDKFKFGAYDIDTNLLKNADFTGYVPDRNDLKSFRNSLAGELMLFKDDGWFHLRNIKRGLSTFRIDFIDLYPFDLFDLILNIVIPLVRCFIPFYDDRDYQESCIDGDIRVKFYYGVSNNKTISTIAWKNGSTLTTHNMNGYDFGLIVNDKVPQSKMLLGNFTNKINKSVKFISLISTIIAGFILFRNNYKRTMFFVFIGIVNSVAYYTLKSAVN